MITSYKLPILLMLLILTGCTANKNTPTQNNQQQTSQETPRAPTASQECPSKYDGTYQGIFTYLYDIPVKDEDGRIIKYKTETSGIRLSTTLKCTSVTDEGVFLEITHVTASHPDFGCQVGGCDITTPQDAPWLNVAYLPLEGTTATHPSLQSMGMYIHFPNGMEITTNSFEGGIYVSMDGQILSNSLDPTNKGRTYSVMDSLSKDGEDFRFPSEAVSQEGRLNIYGSESWKMSKTT